MNNKETLATSNEKDLEQLDDMSLKKQKNSIKKDEFKTRECSVIRFDKSRKFLDVLFNGYGIRIFNVEEFSSSSAVVKYKGEIGNPDFKYGL